MGLTGLPIAQTAYTNRSTAVQWMDGWMDGMDMCVCIYVYVYISFLVFSSNLTRFYYVPVLVGEYFPS